jgi:hypothetical protein
MRFGTEKSDHQDPIRHNEIEQIVEDLETFGDSTFRRVRTDIVSRYRLYEEEQESIAIALARKNSAAKSHRLHDRLEDILSMLDHIHDPFIR